MSYITNELSEKIGRIDDNGYIYDNMDHCFAQITDSGHIIAVAGWDTYGKIDDDGTIRDSSMDVIGRIEADGYVYIHSRRVGKVSSTFIERITPYAWNAGQASSYKGRNNVHKENNYDDSTTIDFLFSPFFIKIIIGIILGIVMMVNGAGGFEMIISAPLFIFLMSFIIKIFN